VKIGWNDLVTSNPDIVAVAPCGYDLERAAVDANRILARPELAQVTAIRTGAVYAIDGNQYFNRPGPRLVDSLEILSEIIAPGSFEGRVAADGFVRMTPTGAIAVS
jgi:iron complex transport system substrate-binding protein